MKRLILTIVCLMLVAPCFGATRIATMMQNNFDSTVVSEISYPRDWMFQYDATYNTPTISTSTTKFGNGSLFCDADGSVMDDYAFPYYTKGSGIGEQYPLGEWTDWTIEFFVNIKQRAPIAGNPTVCIPIYRDRNSYQQSGLTPPERGFQIFTYITDTSAGLPVLVMNGLYIDASLVYTPIQKYISVTIAQSYDTWHHVAVTKQFTASGRSTIRFFWDGGLYGEIYNIQDAYPITQLNDPTNWQQFGGQLGGPFDDVDEYNYNQCPMYIDEFRISRGCRYTWHFTPPTVPFTYPLLSNIDFKENGKINFKENGKINMKFSGGF